MQKRYTLLLSLLLMAVTVTPKAWGQLTNYVFQSGSGSQFSITSGNVVYNGAGQRGSGQGGYDDYASGPYAIGFTFPFAGTGYTTFSLSTNGAISLGNTVVTTTWVNSLTVGSYPMIAPFFDDLRVSGGVQGCGNPAIQYQTSGVAPNRLLTIEFRDMDGQNRYPAWCTFQARLYESGKIEFWYGRMSSCDVCNQFRGCFSGSASIGLAASASDYMSVTLTGGGGTMSRASVNNSNNINSTAINAGTMFTFIPCSLVLTGRTGAGNGGTTTMANGDTFFSGFLTQVGSSSVYTPFSQQMTDVTCAGLCTLAISGPAANDYYLGTPGTLNRTVNLGGGTVDIPNIGFAPTAGGVRSAVLTVTGPGVTRTFNLAARAPFVNYTGIIPQGGTQGMNTGDTLFKGLPVPRHSSQCFTPFSLLNVSGSSQLIHYALTDPTNQYSISADTTLGANGTTAPRICFSPQGFGPQPAMLTVTAGGESRTFVLYAISAAPGADFHIGAQTVGVDLTELFRNRYGCVGEEAVTYAVKVVNTGYGDFMINGAEFYLVDTVYRQGVPSYPYVRDSQGRLIRVYDYWLTRNAPVLPLTPAQTQLPITVHQADSTTVYLSFVGALNGKRFARAILRTNGQSRSGLDTNGVSSEGLVNFDVYAHGSGSMLSDTVGGGLPRAVIFPVTRIGEWAVDTMTVVNNGVCSLRINLTLMDITAGDVDEFEIVTKPSSQVDAVTHDLILPPGASDHIVVRFKPQQIGSRRAGLRLKTNDSNIYVPGITERGVYYVDLFGSGKTDLYGEGGDAGTALIGGGSAEHTKGSVRMKNTRSNPVSIVQVDIVGDDSTDFSSSNWPTLPVLLEPGMEQAFQVEFAPKSGESPGTRKTRLRMITSDGDTVYIPVTGTAGTREIDVTPQDLKFGQLTIGKKSRKNVVIRNTGTMVLTVQQPAVTSTGEFTATQLARTQLDPGQSEIVEVTYAPTVTGLYSGTMDITSNGTATPMVSVTLNGTAKTRKVDDPDPTGTTSGPSVSGEIATSGLEEFSVAGVSGVRDASGMALMQSVPNPGRDLVEIGYSLPVRADVTLALYDDQGRLVLMLDSGTRPIGETRLRVDVSGLAAGLYHYRLMANGNSLSRTLTVVR
ncbi:MAG: choice-of-anchor D domain-containing protein [Bacteroidetes bacterium]|nr:choice-of-anchor D domain-containing protein [Bacteroidota bacterium]